LLVSRELRWTSRLFFGFLLTVGVVFLCLGLFRAYEIRRDSGFVPFTFVLTNILPSVSLGFGVLIMAFGLRAVRQYLVRVQEAAAEQIATIKLGELSETHFEEFDRVRQLREQKAQKDFERNLTSRFVLEHLEIRGTPLFSAAVWQLQPGINVLLGRNGYGKSVLLRALAGLLQHDEEVTGSLLAGANDAADGQLVLRLTRDGEEVVIRRNPFRFAESVGKVPLLAIPDSRVIDRSQQVVMAPAAEAVDLRREGADHFLHLLPYGSVIQSLLYELCLDYWEHGRNFDRPSFRFLEECMRRLTDSEFRFHSITRKGRTGFEITVLNEGSGTPLPLQNASQGTLSLLALFGLVRSYLQSFAPKSEDAVQSAPGVVLIDEADAHLHPAWQQKVPTLLRDLFPNVQFVVSAHSPLFVAGCWNNEVAVLRKAKSRAGGFAIEQLDRDFVGATSGELYQEIFGIEELDDTFLEYSKKATRRETLSDRINELANRQEQGALSAAEEDEFRSLTEESRRIRRVVEVKEQRRLEGDKDLRIADLEAQLHSLDHGPTKRWPEA
jgi:ABC-type multidrug transport system ATPase subunit